MSNRFVQVISVIKYEYRKQSAEKNCKTDPEWLINFWFNVRNASNLISILNEGLLKANRIPVQFIFADQDFYFRHCIQ